MSDDVSGPLWVRPKGGEVRTEVRRRFWSPEVVRRERVGVRFRLPEVRIGS